MRARRLLLRTAVLLVIAVEALVIVSSLWVLAAARGRVVTAGRLPAEAPATALLLGAKAADGRPGSYLRNRIETAAALYRDGTVRTIIASGNDADDAGNEVAVMRAGLIERGVPAAAVVDDPTGLNTAASCAAVRRLGVDAVLVITQSFHAGRAVALCRSEGVEALGVVAPCEGCSAPSYVRNLLREALASRPRALLTAWR